MGRENLCLSSSDGKRYGRWLAVGRFTEEPSVAFPDREKIVSLGGRLVGLTSRRALNIGIVKISAAYCSIKNIAFDPDRCSPTPLDCLEVL